MSCRTLARDRKIRAISTRRRFGWPTRRTIRRHVALPDGPVKGIELTWLRLFSDFRRCVHAHGGQAMVIVVQDRAR
jgi:hypothetical protein